MNRNGQPPDPAGEEMVRFQENRHRYPLEELIPYEGLHVTWNYEGTKIVAKGKTIAEVYEQVLAAGIPANWVVFDFIAEPAVSYLGGLYDSSIVQ